ncbi:hypothetical protein [Vaginisenegalia massiliensis]|uniref:hypothetical protein n=1 Tax=Vaginisenegalia massiliensis TaxID=2058294 RepID=UPI000F540C23|nr:hypothetical protein [Vaginisenegalia massiliensis]
MKQFMRGLTFLLVLIMIGLPIQVHAQNSQIGDQREAVLQLMLEEQADTKLSYDEANAILMGIENAVLEGKEVVTPDAHLSDAVKVKQLNHLSVALESRLIQYIEQFQGLESDVRLKQDQQNSYPYQVKTEKMKVPTLFSLEGANIPTAIKIDVDRKEVTFLDQATGKTYATYQVTIENHPYKTIRLFSHDGSAKRPILANTVVRLGKQIEGTKQAFQEAGPLYLFYNKFGSISLATPNYAGNVDRADQDTMLEYLEQE